MSAPRVQVELYYTEGAGPPPELRPGELAFSEADKQVYIGLSNGAIYTLPFLTLATILAANRDWATIVNRPNTLSGAGITLQLSDIPDGYEYSRLQNAPDVSALDEIEDYSNQGDFPAVGEAGKLYIDLSTGYFYRWTASGYVQLTGLGAVWGQINGAIASQGDLMTALAAKAAAATVPRYVALSPRQQEWNDLAVSTAGQNYPLSSIPQSGNVLVHYFLNPGFAAANTSLTIILEPPSVTKTPPVAGDVFANMTGDAGSRYQPAGNFIHALIAGQGYVLAENGQIWARRNGAYNVGSQQTDLWVLGYWTNPTL